MACGATLSLKRSLEFDPLYSPNSRSPKRRRCMPMTMSPVSPPTKQQGNVSAFLESTPKLSSEAIAHQLSAELKRIQRRRHIMNGGESSSNPPSPGSASPPHHSSSMTGIEPCSSSSMGALSASSSCGTLSPTSKKDVPVFSLRQVSLVCERLLKDREEQIRQEYDKVLSGKLAEQYEAFLKFNHDQLHRRFHEAPASYVS